MRNTNGLTDLKKSYRINNKLYDLFRNPTDNELILIPRTNGSIVRNVSYSAYAYTNGGETYRSAVEKLKQIISEQ